MNKEFQNIQLRMPWKLVCKIAVKALVHKLSFDDMVSFAMKKEVERHKKI